MIGTIWIEQICMNKLNIHDLESSLATPLGWCTKKFKQSDTSYICSVFRNLDIKPLPKASK